jgi:hypothetical protein
LSKRQRPNYFGSSFIHRAPRKATDKPTCTKTYQDLCDPTASDSFRFADNAEEIVG